MLPGETRDVVEGGTYIHWYADKNQLAMTVAATGAEFEDGSHWAAPRTALFRFVTVHQQSCPLMIRNWNLSKSAYELSVQVQDSQIVSYRLAAVRDVPGSFEIKPGKWVEIDPKNRVRGAFLADDGKSLSPLELSELATPRLGKDGSVSLEYSGVAFFVAEVRYADGRSGARMLTGTLCCGLHEISHFIFLT